jgi:hypothetical protein
MKIKLKAQSILEYAVVLAVVSAALAGMQLFFRRGIQASIKLAADQIGAQQDSADVDIVRGGVNISSASTSNAQTLSSSTESTSRFVGGAQRKDIDINRTTSGSSTFITTETE